MKPGKFMVTARLRIVIDEAANENHAMSKVLALAPEGWNLDSLQARFVPDKPEKEDDLDDL